ncbi:MAG: Methyltransferase type 11 [Candidatus Magasanikbacteria bacterium GW2011_GWD2_43_18]|uniref:Methyltransferase type 11 n=1 Tax=Candidatus Magasanikbacteria bacterium GW2011_GWE2_42_7 TaxID=1619052 RepID=A0A0G1BGK8_9BACT|nr:MAG: Methyltransferase type 11 [Candidatus Magasanikbacteria bacterium GW2011_GWC2_42_27]KKS72550.1 MAG: Methyltransferase type 11 [Candidatus Magasanikbacteria bacterium GW2011_GWE2_42_7]KKT05256.1 MAG: Methyltransferase type 11 [Candidatus Magasanikbacteria bacterium GW2011_GWD2_43_18]KKT26122.1 MAG: Methyltransferase type 11 [Candidatus Magasanikbacteria bacterium GW2011_GWA2_43_9]HBB37593.1 hypothetical protein [Candidatus Magasanikbacteria bacterium]
MLRFLTQTWHRNILEDLLKKHADMFSGKILDVGSERRRYDAYFHAAVDAVDIHPDAENNIVFGDIERGLDIPDATYDGIVCTEVVEYLTNYEAAFMEISRLLKPESYAIISIPFMYPDHKDNIRFTDQFAKKMISKYFSEVSFTPMGNKWTVIWDACRLAFLRSWGRYLGFGKYVVLFPCVLLYVGSVKLFGLHKQVDEFYSGQFIVVKK